ncbi:hypothetical protein [Caldisericum sp.]|uniref:hypothetical protein n=1 Tax=Caldisericum sp. TaxID=2499687 RepID=UPI003D14EB51
MIPYRKTLIRDIMDEVVLRARNFINFYNYDSEFLLTQVIQSIRTTGFHLLPFRVWALTKQIPVTHRTTLPLDFISPIRLIIQEPKLAEARLVDFREYYQLANWRYQHSWNKSTELNPIYCITGVSHNKVIFIAPNNDYQTGTPPPPLKYYTGAPLQGILEYHSVPNYNDLNENSYLPLPEEFKELVILETTIRFLSKVTDNYYLLNLHKNLVEKKTKLWDEYVKKLQSEYKEMDEFTEPIPPFSTQPAVVPGELPNRLI